MKKLLLLLLVLLTLPAVARRDSVFELELECAQRTLRCGRATYVSLQFALFQEAALLYLQEKQQSIRDTARINRRWLDLQAFNMTDFLSLYYVSFVNDQLSIEDHEILRLMFRDVSLSTPCFYDDNERVALRFVFPDESLVTPFSLDTDWQKAYEKVQSVLKDSKYKKLLQQYESVRKELNCSSVD